LREVGALCPRGNGKSRHEIPKQEKKKKKKRILDIMNIVK
jgi:hypothetical protein